MNYELITPPGLREGDTVAILSPATAVKEEYIDGAAAFLRSRGFRTVVMPAAKGPKSGTYAAAQEARIADFQAAVADPEVKAILCSRGGYGCVHLAAATPLSLLRENPKWVIGFSDVSALHAMMLRAGVASLHAGMAKHLTQSPADALSVSAFLSILGGAEEVTYRIPVDAHEGPNTLGERRFLIEGECGGMLRGGNWAVLEGLLGTDMDPLRIADGEEVILFLEDVGEAVYRTERMLWQLYLSGTLERVKGLIFGDFSETGEDINFGSAEAMIAARLKEWGVKCPVVGGFPVGHADGRNLPLVQGAKARLSVTREEIMLSMSI